MNEAELKEVMRLLQEAGVRAELCNTAVPVSTSSVHCGLPTEMLKEDT